jgi:nucleolar GTP-binding protein
VAADYYMSIAEDDNVETVLDAAIEAVDYEPELPFEEG